MPTLLIIPAYNESQNLGNVLQGLLDLKFDVDILVVDDGSSDNTEAIATSYPVDVVSHPCNLGYGAALQTGYKYASMLNYTQVIQFDADGQHNPMDVAAIMAGFRLTTADVIIGSRFKGDVTFTPGTTKLFAIRLFRGLIWAVTRTQLTDPTSGLRGLSANVFQYYSGFNRFPNDFPDADFLIDVLLQRFDVVEVAISNRHRNYGTSMHNGLKPIIYIFKVLLSISVIVMNHALFKRRISHE